MGYKSRRSRATDIPAEVKDVVWRRDDGRCIFCGERGLPNAHVVPRSAGGLGVAGNVVTACPYCHRMMDQSPERAAYLARAKEYLRGLYPGWTEGAVTYEKGKGAGPM